MKLLIITDAWHPQVNGVVRTYEHINEQLEKMGHEIHVISPSDFRLTCAMPSYPEIRLTIAPYRRLVRLLEQYAPETIHIATEGPLGMAGRRYCLKNGYSFSTCYHTHFPDYIAARFSRYLPFLHKPVHTLAKNHIRKFHAQTSAMMLGTQSLQEELLSWNFKNPMCRLTRGVDPDLFHAGEPTLFQDLPKPIALFVGRVAVEKNIEAFLSMEWTGSKVIVGDGPSRDKLTKKYPDAHFVGTKTGCELGDHYRSADLFVFPSKTDTFGMVLIEALACGLPIAAYNVTGPKDIITQDFLGNINDDLSKAAQTALCNTEKSKRIAHVKQHYSWEQAAKQFEATMLPLTPPKG